jgi:hypothetical protein
MTDDLSQRLWREGAKRDWQEEQILEAVFSEPVPDTPQTILLKGDIERLKRMIVFEKLVCREQVKLTQRLQDLLGHINLHTADDAFFIMKMGREERELYADAHDAWSARLEPDDPGLMPRWWREDYVGPVPS